MGRRHVPAGEEPVLAGSGREGGNNKESVSADSGHGKTARPGVPEKPISEEAKRRLAVHRWPGNVRELENLIERAVILSHDAELHVPLAELKASATPGSETVSTLEAAEREHIVRALREAGWVIGGSSGAAAKLGMKRTTLQSKMRKLGISRER